MANIKVLCAEDDELMRVEMKEKITAKGWEVVEAADGEEALKKYKECQPDVIILDMDMPKQMGLEVLQLIRVSDLQIPVVIYSSLAEESKLQSALDCGAQIYLIKNYSVDLLVTQVEKWIKPKETAVLTLAQGVTYDFSKAELCISEQHTKLSMLENKVLDILCKNKNKLSTREVLLKAGWDKTDNNLELQLNKVICRLRKLLGETDQVEIILDKGKGYWLKTRNGK